MISYKTIPIRLWIISFIFLHTLLINCIMENFHYCRKMIIKYDSTIVYKPWCQLTGYEKVKSANDSSFKVPWYYIEVIDFGPRYKISHNQRSFINDAQFYGNMISIVPGGVLAENVGPFHILIYSTLFSAILNCLRVYFIAINIKMLLVSEFVLGLHAGLTLPALLVWIARWAPPNERGIFVASQMGYAIATTISRIFIKLMAPLIGWRAIFYNLSIITLIYLIILWFFGCNHPEDHKHISAREVYYIKKSQRGRATNTRSWPPFRSILNSKAFWALNILNFGYTCGLRFYIYTVPDFLHSFIGISKDVTTYVEILPNAGFVFVGVSVGILADFIRIKHIIADTTICRSITIFSHLLPGCVLLFGGVIRCNGTIAIIMFITGYVSMSCGVISCFRTIIDLSPNYSGTIYGLINVSGYIGIILLPKLKQLIFDYNRGIIGWTLLFLVVGGCLMGTGIIFIFFGIDDVQSWNLKYQDRFKLYYYKRQKQFEALNAIKTEKEVAKENQYENLKKNNDKSITEATVKNINNRKINKYEITDNTKESLPKVETRKSQDEAAGTKKSNKKHGRFYYPKRTNKKLDLTKM
ncbi:hypothetical protein ABEB36_003011 [Hypothenemus hampei]|uniref:Major facilitator superfamily (MFS) profile domain-containing protein n=1 Tax=Hypothenemus hampei TaxID=57062 RepID=A0ABD1FAW2_HYPHA